MRLTAHSGIREVAAAVADALAAAGIRAVLSGGACASIYTNGSYQSVDLDFILQSAVTSASLDAAMAIAGFARRGIQYFHRDVRFYVEFPPGPLSIGGDYRIQPIERRIGKTTLLSLSPTDSCRDRLASFFHWNDRQSLKVAITIALRQTVDLDEIREWSSRERATVGFEEFLVELSRARERRNRRRAAPKSNR